jgi:preprotein translocase subunit YajC
MSVESAGAAMGMSSGLMSLLPMVFIFAIFYFFLIRPQVKRQRKVEQMVNELKKGDKVLAAGGLYGTIAKIEDNLVYLEIAENVRIKALKSSVTEVLSGQPVTALKEAVAALKETVKEEKILEKKTKPAVKKKTHLKKNS